MIDSFRGDYYFLSNFYPVTVKYEGLTFESSEAAFQSAKALGKIKRLFCDASASTSKKLGRRIHLRSDWDEIKDEVMYEIVKDKFTRNKELGKRLLATKEQKLVEGNTGGDKYWGVCNGVGQNKLGKILMRFRNELREHGTQ